MMISEFFSFIFIMAVFQYEFTDQSVLSFNLNEEKTTLSSPDVSGPYCNNIELPPLLTEPPMQAEYSQLNEGFLFGESDEADFIATFSYKQHLEVSNFFTNEHDFRRILQFFPTPPNYNWPLIANVSISECPGDFTESAVCSELITHNSFQQMWISTYQQDDPNNFCIIEPGKQYYINMIHDPDPFDDVPSRCFSENNEICSVFYVEIEYR